MEEYTYLAPESTAVGAPETQPEPAPDAAAARARKCVSRVGLALAAMMAAQYAALYLLEAFALEPLRGLPGWEGWQLLLIGIVPMYFVGLPVLLAVMRGLPAESPQKQPAHGLVLRAVPVCAFLTYAGSFAGILLMTWINSLLPNPVPNGVAENIMGEYGWQMTLLMVVVAPVMEELVFRRLLLDHLHMYGQRMAVCVSALVFGLYHGNFYQFFYAVFLGIVFGYVYLKTGKLWHTMALHAGVNFVGSVVASSLSDMELTDSNGDIVQTLAGMREMLLILLFTMAMFGGAIAGLTILIKRRREIRLAPTPADGVTPVRALLTPGMLLFIIAACGSFVLYMLSYQMR